MPNFIQVSNLNAQASLATHQGQVNSQPSLVNPQINLANIVKSFRQVNPQVSLVSPSSQFPSQANPSDQSQVFPSSESLKSIPNYKVLSNCLVIIVFKSSLTYLNYYFL